MFGKTANQNIQHKTILIIEDDPDIRIFLEHLIEGETSFRSMSFPDGELALQQAPFLNPSLLLLDYRLPGMNGIELYDHLQTIESTRNIPAIMMSATLPLDQLRHRGIYQMRKPMDVEKIIQLITNLLNTPEQMQATATRTVKVHERGNRPERY